MPQALKEIETWAGDPEYSGLPHETKRLILNNYFDKNLSDDEFLSLPTETQSTIKENFFSSNIAEKPIAEPEKELDLKDINAALDEKMGAMTSRFQPDIAPAESTAIEELPTPEPQVVDEERILPRQAELRQAPELKESILNVVKKPFLMTPLERSTRAFFIRRIAEDTGLDDKTVDKNYKYLMRQRGHLKERTIAEHLMDMAIFPITAGLASNPAKALLGVGGFMALSEIENAVISRINAEPYKALAGKGLEDLLPEEANQQTRETVELIDLILKGLILHGIKGKAPAIANRFTKNITTEYKIRNKMFISAEKIRSMFQTGEKISPQEADIIKSFGWGGKQYRSAIKTGKEIPFKIEQINTMVDKPWYAKLKTLFRIKPTEKPVGIKPTLRIEGERVVKPAEVTEVPLKAPVVPPERITPVEPTLEPKAEITPEIAPEVPLEAPVVIPEVPVVEEPLVPPTVVSDRGLLYDEQVRIYEDTKPGEQVGIPVFTPEIRSKTGEWTKTLEKGTILEDGATEDHWVVTEGRSGKKRIHLLSDNNETIPGISHDIESGEAIVELATSKVISRNNIPVASLSGVGFKYVQPRGAEIAPEAPVVVPEEKPPIVPEKPVTPEELRKLKVKIKKSEGAKKAYTTRFKDVTLIHPKATTYSLLAVQKAGNYRGNAEFFKNTRIGKNYLNSKPLAPEVSKDKRDTAVEWYNENSTVPVENWDELIDIAQSDLYEAAKYTPEYEKEKLEREKYYGYTLKEVKEMETQQREFEKEAILERGDKEEIDRGADRNIKGEVPDLVKELEVTEEELQIALAEWDRIAKGEKPIVEEPYVIPKEIPPLKPAEIEKPPVAEKVPDEVAETYLNMGIPLVMPDAVQKKINTVKKLFKEPTGIAKRSMDIVKDYWGKKAGLEFKYSDKWNRTLRAKVPVEGKKTIFRTQKFKDKFSPEELEDAMFYRQRIGNHFKSKTDTFKEVANRMPKELRDFVDGEIDEHTRNWMKFWNAAPFTKDIDAREEIIKTYMAGVYAGNINKGYEYLVGLKGRKFVTNNFMRNKKIYLDYGEAFRKGGLVQRYRNIADQMDFQDAHMIKLLLNNELIGRIHQLEKEINSKLIVRANSKLYDEAKTAKDEDGNNLYVPYMDPYLRSYVAGKKPDGSLIWATSKAPALVYRDASDALQSIFSKDAYKPENIFWRNYDRIGSLLRYTRVTFSGFHFVPLAESFIGGKGLSVLNFPKWVKHGKKLLADPVFMEEWKEAGLTVKAPSEVSRKQIEGSIQNIINVLEAQGIEKKILAKGIKYITKPQFRLTRFLFDEYLPLLKVQMVYHYKNLFLSSAEKKGIKYNETQMKEVNREIASIVNDQFGGQAWEMIRVLNDPKIMKWMHRAVGYPNWSISALRQAGAIGEGGIRGKLARRYWLRYGIAFLAIQNALSYLFTGLYNDEDDEDKIKWSWDKAHSTFKNIDPTLKHKIDFQLPDVEIDLPLIGKFNPGRQLKKDGTYGRRYYSHFGKQMLEIPRYALNFNEQMFAKSNPVIQIVFKQIFGGAPYRGGIFPARGGYDIANQYKSWKGKKGLERWRERAIQIVTDATPFSIQSMWSTSPATAGLLPISKATSLYAAQEYIEKALRKDDGNELLNIVTSLLDSGYSIESINRSITTIGNNIIREQEEKSK